MNPVADNSMHIPFKDKIQVHLDDSEGEPSGFDVKAFRVVDRMNELFHIEVVARSANPDIDLESRIGKPARFQVEAPMTPGKPITRNWSGICVDFAQTQVEPNGLSTYRIEIRPMLWQLSQRRNHRLFQHMSVVDIAGQLLDEWGVEHLLKVDAESYPKLELRVQYGETDYDFFERLLEENGIAYYFDEAGGESSKVVLSDAPETREAREAKLDYLDKTFAAENNEVEYATELTLRHRVQPGAIAYRDHDYRRPSLDLKGVADAGADKEARFEHYIYHPGDFLHDEGSGGNTPTADDKGTARHDEKRGQLRAQRTLEAKRVRKRIVTFRTSVIDLSPGITFAIGGHPRGDMGETLLATALEMWAGEEEPWTMVNEAVFASSPYRPEELTPKPRIFGVQTATVVGPSGEE
ncbi:MAG: type VI secretion system tip protein VgrG, partial [Myxococcales bacterium]|nr:type VI secretion system tip protein VgrG [Myxococcales bacterium]